MSLKSSDRLLRVVRRSIPAGAPWLLACSSLIGEGDYHLRTDSDSGPTPGASTAPIVLAHNDGSPSILILDLHNVYWIREASDTAAAAILSVPRAGGPTSVVVDNLQKPSGLRSDSDYLYYTNDRTDPDTGASGIFRVTKTAGKPELVDYDENGFGWLSVHGTSLFTEGVLPDGSAFVRRSEKLGTAPQTPCVVGHAVGRIPIMYAASNEVFFFDTGRGAIMFVTNDCDATESVFAGGQPDVREMSLAGGYLYWTGGTSVFRQPTAGAAQAPQVVATDAAGMYGIDTGSQGIFVTSEAGGTVSLIRADLSVETLATKQSAPRWIVVGSNQPYWANHGTGNIVTLRP